MKSTFAVLAVLGLAALPLMGCETNNSQATAQPAVRDVYVGGQGNQRVAQVPADQTVTDNSAPYALRGSQEPAARQSAPIGYNSRN